MRAGRVLALLLVAGAAACRDRSGPVAPLLPELGDTLLVDSRIAALPADQRTAWQAYLASSRSGRAGDSLPVADEARAAGQAGFTPAPLGSDFYLTSQMTGAWFGGAEAERIAGVVISFQTPTGGWSKAVDLLTRARRPGEGFSSTSSWSWISTFDNGATTEELRFLGAVARAQGNPRDTAAFMKGLRYIARAQFPNGCWPQVYPLEGSYHDAATFNDAAMVRVMSLLDAVGRGDYPFVPEAERAAASAASARGLSCTLAAQVVTGGQRTVWAQQHDPLTLAPVQARAYEPAALCSLESAGIMDYLMALAAPRSDAVAAVRGAAAWFRANAIYGYEYRQPDLVPVAGAGPLWARFYEPGTLRPIFGDRDGSVHYVLGEISLERRLGYAWYSTSPAASLRRFDAWAPQHPASRIWTSGGPAGY